MSQSALSPSPTLLDSEPTHEQPPSPVSVHSDNSDDTESTHEEPSSPVTAPSDHSDGTADAADSATSADPKASTSEAEMKERKPLSKVQELAAWYDSQANGNLRLQVLTWDGKAVDAPKHESKKLKKSLQAEEGLM